ncbi:ROK family transcriptional regulator [Aggregatilinea lenta]|uniref:ROK family transcriptional regulator n=1 Tax=Aggregatilinea lenta TaxID=913108 RepID=UPI000E5B8E4E|nr:ROK family transcriptional regulator [Aggregatilinea lenta]
MLISQLYPTAETPADIRQRNRFAVLRLLRDHDPLSKSDLVRFTDRTNTTIATILDGLLAEGLVETVNETGSLAGTTRGRPASLYRLSTARWLAAGIQIASNSVTAIIMTLDATIVAQGSAPAPEDLAAEDVLDIAGNLLDDLIERTQELNMSLLGLGVALEGFVSPETGESLWMLFRSKWKDVPVRAYLEQRFRLPVMIDYRVYAAALAEASYGAARGIQDFVYLNIDTGIATATVSSGALVRSSTQPAGITGGLGHVLTSRSSRPCFCGNIGCLHNEITIQALTAQLGEFLTLGRGHGIGLFWEDHAPTFENLIAAVRQNDALALQIRDRFIENLGIAVTGAIQLYSANLLIVGGPTLHFGGPEALEAAQHAIQRLTILHELLGSTKVIASTLLPDSATVGAATLVVHAVMVGTITPDLALE